VRRLRLTRLQVDEPETDGTPERGSRWRRAESSENESEVTEGEADD
jgi:hypothetical protein